MKNPFRTLTLLAALLVALLLAAAPAKQAAAQDSAWFTQFWNNTSLSGPTAATRFDSTINFDWGHNSPQPGVNADNFSARWTRNVYFAPGTYRFTATMDDGMRFFMDGRLLIDSWNPSQLHTMTTDVAVTGGNHDLRVDYFDEGGVAVAQFSWQLISSGGGGGGSGSGGGGVVTPPQFPNWRAQYWNNPRLEGQAQLVRDDRYLNQNWGLGSPAPGVIATDFFSARFTRTINGNPGLYRLTLRSDDGARMFVNNILVLDGWTVTPVGTVLTTDYFYPGGPVEVRVDYYENTGQAFIEAGLALVPGSGGGGTIQPPVTDSNGCSPVQGMWAYVNTGNLNFRTGPDASFPIVTTLPKCTVVGLTGMANPSRTWVQANLPGGGTGWANASFMVLGVPISQLRTTQ